MEYINNGCSGCAATHDSRTPWGCDRCVEGRHEPYKAQYAIKCRCGVLTHFYDRRYKAAGIWNRRAHET